MRKRLTGSEPLFLGEHEIVVDNFAGGGGASAGIEQAFGRPVDVAINHDPEAVAMHAINHPRTRHYCESVFKVNPTEITEGKPVALAWFSPDCKHHSKARGGKPRDNNIRGLAWVVIRWARRVKPRVIMLENVEEFQDWGPLTDDDLPCPLRKGMTFRLWVNQLRGCGYQVEWKQLRACDYGAPTIRKRLFLIARCDGLPIVWPAPTHGPGLVPYRTAAECIDWSTPCPSIFDRKRPLAENTMRRIGRGTWKYVINAAEPFIVPVTRTSDSVSCIHDPLRTITTAKGGEFALVAPTLIQTGYGERDGQAPRSLNLHKPLGTIVSGGKHALVAAFLAKHNGIGAKQVVGQSAGVPLHTITGTDQKAVVTAILSNQYSSNAAGGNGDLRGPMTTVTSAGQHQALVQAFLIKYYSTDQTPHLRDPLHTITATDRFGLVTVHGERYRIIDIGMRMLTRRELFNAQGFPANYIIGDDPRQGLILTNKASVRMCGNSVPPPLSRALALANCVATSGRIAA